MFLSEFSATATASASHCDHHFLSRQIDASPAYAGKKYWEYYKGLPGVTVTKSNLAYKVLTAGPDGGPTPGPGPPPPPLPPPPAMAFISSLLLLLHSSRFPLRAPVPSAAAAVAGQVQLRCLLFRDL